MAYGEKYKFIFQSDNGVVHQIRLYQDGYSGSVTQRPLGGAPLLKKKNSGNICGTSLEFKAECIVDQEFASLYTSSPYEFRVDLYRNGTMIWRGFVEPELYSEPDIAPPYDVSIIATDGLGELKNHIFEPQGAKSINGLILSILEFTGNNTTVKYISNLQGTTEQSVALSALNTISSATINIDYMAGETCYDVLQYIMDTLHATITLYQNYWMVCRETDFTWSGTSVSVIGGTLSNAVQPVGKMGASQSGVKNMWPVGNLTTKVEPAKCFVSVVAPYHQTTPIVNPDMTSNYGWLCTGIYDSALGAYDTQQGVISQTVENLDLSEALTLKTLIGNRSSLSKTVYLHLEFTPDESQDYFRLYDDGEGAGLQWKLPSEIPLLAKQGIPLNCGAWGSPIDNTADVPAFDRTGYEQTGSLFIRFGLLQPSLVYSCGLYYPCPKGYRDNLNLDNDARTTTGDVEIAIGYEVSSLSSHKKFFDGFLFYDGDMVVSYSDRHFSSLDYLALLSRGYALSVALPRLRIQGTLDTKDNALVMPPMALKKDNVCYLIETSSWDLLHDELQIDALSLPAAELDIQDETITDITGDVMASGDLPGGGGGGGGTSSAQIAALETRVELIESLIGEDDNHNAYVKPYGANPREFTNEGGGHFRDLSLEPQSSPSGTAVLEVLSYTENNVTYQYLHSRLPICSDSQIVAGGIGSGSGGGGGTTVLWGNDAQNGYETLVVEGYTGNQRVVALQGHTHAVGDVFTGIGSSTPSTGDTLVYGQNGWTYGASGGVASVAGLTGVITSSALATAMGLEAAAYKALASTISASDSGLVTADQVADYVDDELTDLVQTYGLDDIQPIVSAMGSTTRPVYISAAGTFALANTYAGGTLVTLNGTPKGGDSATFYAPTTAGTSGNYLVSAGTGNSPSWTAPGTTASDISASSTVLVTGKAVYDYLANLVSMFELVGSGTSADPYLIHALYPLYSDGFITAGGVGSGSGGGGGAQYLGQLEDVTLTTPSYRQVLWLNNSGTWVNHTLSADDISGLSSGYVTLGTAQTISGLKTFANNIVPDEARSRQLGTSSLFWKSLYAEDLYVKGFVALRKAGDTYATGVTSDGGFHFYARNSNDTWIEGLRVMPTETVVCAHANNTHLRPDANGTKNLGTSSYGWANLYLANSGNIYAGSNARITVSNTARQHVTVSNDLKVVGDIWLKGSDDYGNKIVFGDRPSGTGTPYCYIGELADDELSLVANKLNLTSNSTDINLSAREDINITARESLNLECIEEVINVTGNVTPTANTYNLGGSSSSKFWNNLYVKRWYPVPGDSTLYVEYSSTYDAFYFHGNVVASGYICAGGVAPTS